MLCTDATKTLTAGKAAIGGAFQLIDGNGKTFTEKELLGQFALLYFGFTFCPDICPDELDKMAKAVTILGKALYKQQLECWVDHNHLAASAHPLISTLHHADNANKTVQPVFISIDPERDNPKQVKEYVKEFHPRLLGLTGSTQQV